MTTDNIYCRLDRKLTARNKDYKIGLIINVFNILLALDDDEGVI